VPSLRRNLGAELAALYLASVLALFVVERSTGLVDPAGLASSPAALAAGKVWTLLTSGLVIDGTAAPQLVVTAALALAALRCGGTRLFWTAAAAGHIGSTLIAYSGVGLVWLVDERLVDGVVRAPDYGISCIWAAGLGVVAAGAWLRGGTPGRAVAVASLGVLATVTVYSHGIATVEHGLAWILGAVVAVAAARHSAAAAERLPLRA
jgi:hypothetical protein